MTQTNRIAMLLLFTLVLAIAPGSLCHARYSPQATQELYAAIDSNSFTAAKAAIAGGADVNARFSHGSTALMLAAEGGDVDIVKALLAHGAHLHAQCGCGWTVLMHAAAGGDNVPMLQLLLDHGLNVNRAAQSAKTQDKLQTALETAAFYGSAANVKYLLARGAKVNTKDRHGKTALIYVHQKYATAGTGQQRQAYAQIIALLEQAGAKQ